MLSKVCRIGIAVIALCVALPATADTRFRVRRMTRDDVPRAKGQCDIRLQVDDEVEVSVRGDDVFVRTIRGQDARDDGSECNAPLPRGPIVGFNFEVKDSRNQIRLLAPPDRRNDFAAVVYIRDSDGGFGRYHFRLSWDLYATDAARPGDGRRDDFDRPRRDDDDRRGGFVWNNVINFRGQGRGSAVFNDNDMRRLFDANVDVDRGGHIRVEFRTERGRPVVFTGMVVGREEGGRLKADVASEDGRLRGPMFLAVDDRQNIVSVNLDASDGRDRVRINWDRR